MKKNGVAILKHDAKRCYVYNYGNKALDGKITISKRMLGNSDFDFIDAIESGDVEIINSSDCEKLIPIPAMEVDEVALMLLSRIISVYEDKGAMPEEIRVNEK